MNEKGKNMDMERIGPERVAEFFKAFSPGSIADLGCGDGGFLKTVLAAVPGYEMAFGVDPSESAIEAASELFQDEMRVSFIQSSAERIPLKDGCIDLAIMSYSLHHLERPAIVLAEVARILSAKGALALQDFVDEDLDDLQRLREEYHALRGEIDVARGGYMRSIYRIAEIEGLLDAAGFRRERVVLVIKNTEPGREAAPRLTQALQKEAARIADAGVRDDILRRASAVIKRIETVGLRIAPSYLTEWRPER